MSKLGLIVAALGLSFSHWSHAAGGPTRFGPKPKAAQVDFGDGCVYDLAPPTTEVGESLKPTPLPAELDGTIFGELINGTKTITFNKYSDLYADNREQQVAAAHELAKAIGRGIFALIGDPDKGDQIQDLIMNHLGNLPPNSLATLQSILEEDTLAALDAKKPQNTVSKRTDNSLAEIATVLSKFREQSGDKTVDVNTVSNILNRFTPFGHWGKAAADAGDYLRVNYQNAVQVINLHREVLTAGIIYQRHMQTQYRYARRESIVLMNYLDMSLIVAQDLKKIFDDAVERSNLNDADTAWVNRAILDPIRNVTTQLQNMSLTVFNGYLTLGELMDRNLVVIRGLHSTRELTSLQMTIGAAGKSGIKKLDGKIDLINNLSDLGNKIARENVAGLRELAERTQEMIKKDVANSQEMVQIADLLLVTLNDIRKGDAALRPVRDAIALEVDKRSAQLRAEGLSYQAIDKIRLADEVKKEQTGRTSGQVEREADGVDLGAGAP